MLWTASDPPASEKMSAEISDAVKATAYYSRRANPQINQIFIIHPSLCNIAALP